MAYHTTLRGERYSFVDLRELLAKANEEKSGDQLAGIAAQNERERIAAKYALADVTFSELVEQPLIDPDRDDITRLILETLDLSAFARVRSQTIGEFRQWLLDSETREEEIRGVRWGITPEIGAAAAKLMSNKELVVVASKIRNVTRCRNTMGEPGVLGIRIQPNHPADDLGGIILSAVDGLLYGCGDAVIGVNPATESVEVVSMILQGLDRLIHTCGIPTQSCCLAHITTQLACVERGVPVDLLFQSLAGTQQANASFGITLNLLREGRQQVQEQHRRRDVDWIGEQIMYFETGQGSALSADAHHGIDQLTLEARAYGVARTLDPYICAASSRWRGDVTGGCPDILITAYRKTSFMQLQDNRSIDTDEARTVDDDVRTLAYMGYSQELARRMNGFSNLALSMSIICILAGGITSFHLGLCGVGGAAIGLGWPLVCLFSLVVALTMAQVASAFPTAGGLYHWAAILGGRGWGWATAWFNLVGLITVLAAINVGTYEFIRGAFFAHWERNLATQWLAVSLITGSQAGLNHLGIRVTTFLTDVSGYWILIVAALLTVALLGCAPTFEPSRLITFTNFSGLPVEQPVWPATHSLPWLFALGFLLPAYTITGFDASAHVSEETIGAARNVPRGIVRSVLISGVAGWIMLAAVVLAIPDMALMARQGSQVFFWTVNQVLPNRLVMMLFVGIALAQYFCGLATVTSASRMTYAFARDGGLPASRWLGRVCSRFRTPDAAIWTVAVAAVLFTLYTPVYSTITAVCTIFLYISYVLPTAIGVVAFQRWWTSVGPWNLGRWYRPLAILSVAGCLGLIVIGMQPPNEKAAWVVIGSIAVLGISWFVGVRQMFRGPPCSLDVLQRK